MSRNLMLSLLLVPVLAIALAAPASAQFLAKSATSATTSSVTAIPVTTLTLPIGFPTGTYRVVASTQYTYTTTLPALGKCKIVVKRARGTAAQTTLRTYEQAPTATAVYNDVVLASFDAVDSTTCAWAYTLYLSSTGGSKIATLYVPYLYLERVGSASNWPH